MSRSALTTIFLLMAAVVLVLAPALGVSECPPANLSSEIANPTPAETDYFGNSLAMDGNKILVKAYKKGGDLWPTGVAYIYDATTGQLLLTLNNPEPESDKDFGASVAISNNLAAVTAYSGEYSSEDGAVHIFDATTGDLVRTISSPLYGFGYSIALSGNRVLVGAPEDDTESLVATGTAFVYDATTGALIHTLEAPTPREGEEFGNAVALTDTKAIVGTNDEYSDFYQNPEQIYVYDLATGTFEGAISEGEIPEENDDLYNLGFGASLAASGNLLIVGDRTHRRNGSSPGAAFVFNLTTRDLVSTLYDPTPIDLDFFGESVAIDGDLAVVGAVLNDAGGILNSGGSFLYHAPTGTFQGAFFHPTPVAWDQLGDSVGLSGNVLVSGAPGVNVGEFPEAGSLFIFTLLDDAVISEHTIPALVPQNHAWPATITPCNTGNTTWTSQDNFSLRIIADSCGSSSGTEISIDPDLSAAPGASHSFTTNLLGLTTLGPCNLQFQMTHNGIPFGEILNVSPEVVAAVNNADFIGHALPTTMPPNTSLTYSLSFKNTGNTAWLPTGPHALGVFTSDACNLFSQTRFQSSEPILPNKNFTAFVHITSPAAPAECTFTLQMIEEAVEWFGEPLTHTITIADPPNATSDWAIYQ